MSRKGSWGIKLKFQLKILNQYRAILILVVIVLSLVSSLLILITTKIMIGLISVFVILICSFSFSYYYTIQSTEVDISNGKLKFRHVRKPIFNYKKIPEIELDNIILLVIDESKFLQKIITNSGEYSLGFPKFFNKEGDVFITYLTAKTPNKIVIDSWDFIKRKGFLKYVYWFNIIFMIVIISVLLIAIILNKYQINHLLFVIAGLLQSLSLHFLISKKRKI